MKGKGEIMTRFEKKQISLGIYKEKRGGLEKREQRLI